MNKTNQKGFTLVELMVVVAIIGILSAIAIPNFNRYQRNAKKPEGKLALSEVYTAQVTYNGQFNRYSTLITNELGINKRRQYYSFGLGTAATSSLTALENGAPALTQFQVTPALGINAVGAPPSFVAAAISGIGGPTGDPGNHAFAVDEQQFFVDSDNIPTQATGFTGTISAFSLGAAAPAGP